MAGTGTRHMPRVITSVSLLLWMLRYCLVAYTAVEASQNLLAFWRICSKHMGLKHSNFSRNAGTILPYYTALYPWWQGSLYQTPWGETEFLYTLSVFASTRIFFFHKINTCDLTEILINIWVNVDLIDKVSTNFIEIYLPTFINPLKPELNPIYYLLALLGYHHFLHVSRIRVKLLTLRRLMSYIYGAPILDVSRSHTTTQHSR